MKLMSTFTEWRKESPVFPLSNLSALVLICMIGFAFPSNAGAQVWIEDLILRVSAQETDNEIFFSDKDLESAYDLSNQYPAPRMNQDLSDAEKIETVVVRNLQGELVWQKSDISQERLLEVFPKLEKGLYLIHMGTAHTKLNHKVAITE